MRKTVKSTLVAVSSIVLLAGTFIAYLAATFDHNEHKAAMIQALRDESGRTLEFKGDIGLKLFPTRSRIG